MKKALTFLKESTFAESELFLFFYLSFFGIGSVVALHFITKAMYS